MEVFFILVLLNHISRKKVLKYHPRKNINSGMTQNGSISADWIFRVAIFGLNYLLFLNYFPISFVPIMQQISWFFSKHHKHFKFGWFWRETKNLKNEKSETMPYWVKPEIFQLFSCLYGSEVPKLKSTHILLWKEYKILKIYLKIPDLQALTLGRIKKMTLYIKAPQ